MVFAPRFRATDPAAPARMPPAPACAAAVATCGTGLPAARSMAGALIVTTSPVTARVLAPAKLAATASPALPLWFVALASAVPDRFPPDEAWTDTAPPAVTDVFAATSARVRGRATF